MQGRAHLALVPSRAMKHLGGMQSAVTKGAEAHKPAATGTAMTVLLALSFCHLINDMTQSLLPAMYPTFKDSFQLSFAQVGFITLVNQLTASLLQPLVGLYTDRRPRPYSLAVGMGFTSCGLLLLSVA